MDGGSGLRALAATAANIETPIATATSAIPLRIDSLLDLSKILLTKFIDNHLKPKEKPPKLGGF